MNSADSIGMPLAGTVAAMHELAPDGAHVKALEYHVKTGDYFAMLATIMGFIEETLATAKASNQALKDREMALLAEIRKDLQHLHNNYRIEPKTAP